MPFLLLALILVVSCQKQIPETPKVRQDEIQKEEERDVERAVAEIQ